MMHGISPLNEANWLSISACIQSLTMNKDAFLNVQDGPNAFDLLRLIRTIGLRMGQMHLTFSD